MLTLSTTPLTTGQLFTKRILDWNLDQNVVPERYAIQGHVTTPDATELVDSINRAYSGPRTVTGLRHAWAVFTKHAADCYIASVEADPDPEDEESSTPVAELLYHLCTCGTYEQEASWSLPAVREVPGPGDGAIAMTWVEAMPTGEKAS